MPDICLLMRSGAMLNNEIRNTLYSIAQYMIETRTDSLSFEIGEQPSLTSIRTDFKTGRHESVTGTIFSARIEYHNGTFTETLFLAQYHKDWRVHCNDKWDVEVYYALGGSPEENAKN